MDKTKQKTSKEKLPTVIIVIATIILLALGGFVIFNNFFPEKAPTPDGVVGKISSDWDVYTQNEPVSKSSGTKIPGYSTAEMYAGDNSLHISIGNPQTNECGFYATLMLEDGTVLYKSELLKPGYGLTEVPLSQTLEKGNYTALVYYECVTLDEAHTPMNSAESEFTLVVK